VCCIKHDLVLSTLNVKPTASCTAKHAGAGADHTYSYVDKTAPQAISAVTAILLCSIFEFLVFKRLLTYSYFHTHFAEQN